MMRIQQFFDQRVSEGVRLVLVTVFETRGSTYSKAGGQMVIDAEGNFCGMLSGGCLEGDLVLRARHVLDTGVAETATYDLGDDDELWGLGVGCDGVMRVLLQPLLPERGHQPFSALVEVMNSVAAADLAVVIDADSAEVAAGATLIVQGGETQCFGMSRAVADCLAQTMEPERSGGMRRLDTPEGRCKVFYSRVLPSPSLLVLGAGLDSEPVVRIAAELGWRITVCDHRPAYISSRVFPQGVRALSRPVEALLLADSPGAFDMAVVMNHHLEADRACLRQLAATDIAYIGLLGPKARRDRLLGESSAMAKALAGRLHGPAGIDLGGRGPGPIALAIVAEMQQFLSERVQIGRRIDVDGRRVE